MASEEVNGVKDVEESLSKDELLKALDEDFATSVSKIYVNSLKQEVGFKEVSVKDQKTISRIMIANEQRKDVVYDAQCAIINKTALLDGFDIYQLTEFDRLKLLVALYQNNIFSNEVKFTCTKCGTENQYVLDFGSTLRKLDQFDMSPKEFIFDSRGFTYKFLASYPKVRLVSDFYKSKYAKQANGMQKIGSPAAPRRRPDGRPEVSKDMANLETQLINMEYINLFVKSVEITNKQKGTSRLVDLEKYALTYGVTAIEEIFSKFSQDVLYADNGILRFIADNLLKTMNDTFDKHACINCGEIYEGEETNQAEGFL